MINSRTQMRDRLRSLDSIVTLIATTRILLAGAGSTPAFAQDPTHLRVSGSGWNHFKLAAGSGGLWSPASSPATGQTGLER